MKTFAENIIAFNKQLNFDGFLPDGIEVINPFRNNPEADLLSQSFYRKYYNDHTRRRIILGINPGRFGAGVTGIPFTDPKRVIEKCKLVYKGEPKHEPSSVFVYEVIDAFGGPVQFYKQFYISSVCPLGFIKLNEKGRYVNYNYYDDELLTRSVQKFIRESLEIQLSFGIETDIAYCFGSGKNEKFLRHLNREMKIFDEIIPLEHPRFIMQYQSRNRTKYIHKYLRAFERANI